MTSGRGKKRQPPGGGSVVGSASESGHYAARFAFGSGMSFSRSALVCAGSVFVAALLLYTRTLAPTVTLVDSGELIVAARCAGVPHPPGFPLWVMLAHVASLMPFGSVAARVNFASAVFAALACGVFTLAVAELMIIASYLSNRNPGRKSAPKSENASHGGIAGRLDSTNMRLLVLAPAVASGLLLAFSRTLWSYATIAEVYTLNTLLIVIVIFFMLRWRRRVIEETSHPNTVAPSSKHGGAITHDDSWLYAAAFVFGLGLGVHHVTVALILPSLALLVYRTQGLCFFTSKKLLFAAVFSVYSSRRGICILADRSFARAHSQLGQSALAHANLVACYGPAVPGILLFYAAGCRRTVGRIRQDVFARIRSGMDSFRACPCHRGFSLCV